MLEVDELGGRMRTARRELYELRFKHAVGQLENSSQISKARHDIARIMTVLHERDFGILASVSPDALTSPDSGESQKVTSPQAGRSQAQPGGGEVESAQVAEEAPAKPKRTRKKAEDKS
jgi:large subunit ribosomal protein L29